MATVSEIKTYQKDQVIMEFKGKIKSFFPKKEPNQFGDAVQNATLEDFNGELIRASFKNCQELKDGDKGAVITMASQNIPKRGFLGVKYGPYTNKDGQLVPQIVITKSALIQIGEIPQEVKEQIKNFAPNAKLTDVKEEYPHKPTTPSPSAPVPPKANKSAETSEYWERKDKRQYKAMALAYAKDLVVANKLDPSELEMRADQFSNYIMEIEVPEQDTSHPTKEDDIPFGE